jgi:hypothetical protein
MIKFRIYFRKLIKIKQHYLNKIKKGYQRAIIK